MTPIEVLYIESDPVLAQAIAEAFPDQAIAIVAARTPLAARREAKASNVDCVVIDAGPPDGFGVALAREIRGLTTLPIVVLVEPGENTDRLREIGIELCVEKPIAPLALADRLHTLLAG